MMHVLTDWIEKFWEEWELRAMVLLSLILQVILILLGKRRKYVSGNWLQIILWLCYMSADSLATFALSVLSWTQGQHGANESIAKAIWAPFLLLHLGSPDTITAYSLEDNELWLRHLLGLVFQVSVAFYVFLKSWVGSRFSILTLLMFVPGIIKYGEKNWALRRASNSMLSPRDDKGPNNRTHFMGGKKNVSKKLQDIPEAKRRTNINDFRLQIPVDQVDLSDAEILHKAYHFFVIFKDLFTGHILSIQEWEQSKSFFLQTSWRSSFKMIEVELGFMFDVLYTKATLAYTYVGFFLRLVCLAFTINSFLLFLTLEKDQYPDMDIITTYVLFVGAITLEIYSAINILIFSDWAFLWLSQKKIKMIPTIVSGAMERRLTCRKRWPASVGQCSIITCCLKDISSTVIVGVVQKLFCIDKVLEKHRWYMISNALQQDELRKLIFQQLKAKAENMTLEEKDTYPFPCTGDGVLRNNNYIWHLIQNTLGEENFGKSILIWHIATDICYESRFHISSATESKRELSKLLSDYMMYLLLMCPFMLPEGNGMIRFRDTFAEVKEVFEKTKSSKLDKSEACKKLLESTKVNFGSNTSESVLFEGCRLAERLKRSKEEANLDVWAETLPNVWMKMVCHAADKCTGTIHAQQLKRGGELLTHIWLLMAHLGLTRRVRFTTEGQQHKPNCLKG
ncbi:uncharacterized protein LOC122653124 [Telopea speciosissima]|uniref:uncharacterized protein LOC122653124 n=1 Tax=Telopea speciosissima TaxID=54955 RepID=UPI001CC6A49A|nr:uncharacterized protein LOC122653124 [Telopea speciosissima]